MKVRLVLFTFCVVFFCLLYWGKGASDESESIEAVVRTFWQLGIEKDRERIESFIAPPPKDFLEYPEAESPPEASLFGMPVGSGRPLETTVIRDLMEITIEGLGTVPKKLLSVRVVEQNRTEAVVRILHSGLGIAPEGTPTTGYLLKVDGHWKIIMIGDGFGSGSKPRRDFGK